ncbi:hypothetical protein ACFL6P_08735 [Candidatus Latescibacterota bacterium]
MINKYVKHRGRVFIQKTFQLKIILRFLVILAFGGFVSGLVLYFFASNELETKLYQAHMNIINTLDILLPIIIITSFSVFLLLSLITIYTVLYLSHRIACTNLKRSPKRSNAGIWLSKCSFARKMSCCRSRQRLKKC